MNARNLLRGKHGRRARASRRAAISMLVIAALVISVLVSGMGAMAPKAAAATCGTTNVALNKTDHRLLDGERRLPRPERRVDGNTGTRWSSAFSDPQWLHVDLGSVAEHQRGDAELGGRLRDGVPDPGVHRRRRGPPSTPRPRAPAACRPSTFPAPAATSGCTAPRGAPRTATRCGSSRSSPRAAAPVPAAWRSRLAARRRRRSWPTRTSPAARPRP